MPTLEDILGDRSTFPDDRKITMEGGVETTLGQLRGGYMKDADYRQKTAKVAEDRRKFESDRTEWETARLDAEGKLTELARSIVESRPSAGRDELTEALERDPVAKALRDEIVGLKRDLQSVSETTKAQSEQIRKGEMAYLADQHRRVLGYLKQQDPELVEQDLVNFAQQRMIPRLDDAYRLFRYDETIKKEKAAAAEEASKKSYEKAKNELNQPFLPARRVVTPSPDAPKDFNEAAEAALRDPEIMGDLSAWLTNPH